MSEPANCPKCGGKSKRLIGAIPHPRALIKCSRCGHTVEVRFEEGDEQVFDPELVEPAMRKCDRLWEKQPEPVNPLIKAASADIELYLSDPDIGTTRDHTRKVLAIIQKRLGPVLDAAVYMRECLEREQTDANEKYDAAVKAASE